MRGVFVLLIYCICAKMISIEGFRKGIMRPNDSGFRITDHWREDKHKREGDFRYEGIFERFIRKTLDVLINDVRGKKLKRYCRYLHRELRTMGFKYTNRLSKIFKDLSKDDSDDIKQEFIEYRKEVDKKLPHRIEFFKAINEVFNLQQNVVFEDYLYELRNYGNGDRLAEDLHKLTHKILHGIILNSIIKLRYKDQKELEKKLRRAVREYKGESDDPYEFQKVLESGTFPPRRGGDCENGQCEVNVFHGVDVGTNLYE